jgi:hypothetical protein
MQVFCASPAELAIRPPEARQEAPGGMSNPPSTKVYLDRTVYDVT